MLTLSSDSVPITRLIAKFFHRLARKAAGQAEARYGIGELHKRSGSKVPRPNFQQVSQDIVDAPAPLPDDHLALLGSERELVLTMESRCRWFLSGAPAIDPSAAAKTFCHVTDDDAVRTVRPTAIDAVPASIIPSGHPRPFSPASLVEMADDDVIKDPRPRSR